MSTRRKFMKSIATSAIAGGFLLSSGSALAGSGSGKANFQDLSFVFYGEGDGAPKPMEARFSPEELKLLNSVEPEDRPEALAKLLKGKMAFDWAISKDGGEFDISLEDIRSVIDKGEGVVRAMSRSPKFQITIKIVIKF